MKEDACSPYDKGERLMYSLFPPYAIGRSLCLRFSKEVRKDRMVNREAVLAEISGLEEDIRNIDKKYSEGFSNPNSPENTIGAPT